MPTTSPLDLPLAVLPASVSALAFTLAAFTLGASKVLPDFVQVLRNWGAGLLAAGAASGWFAVHPATGADSLDLLWPALAFAALAWQCRALDVLIGRARPGEAATGLALASLATLAWAQAYEGSSALSSLASSLGAASLSALLAAHAIHLWRRQGGFADAAMLLFATATTAGWLAVAALAWFTPAAWPTGVWPTLSIVAVACLAGTSFALHAQLHERQRAALQERLHRDGLTGLYNRATFFEMAAHYLAGCRAGTPYALVMADIDNFKRVNDDYGHLVGDRVLAYAARCLQATTRLEDVAGRYGGEEFCVLLKDCDRERAMHYAHRLLESVANCVSLRDNRSVCITFSVGFATGIAGSGDGGLMAVLGRADQALLVAKSQGRNRVREGSPAARVQDVQDVDCIACAAAGGGHVRRDGSGMPSCGAALER